MGRRYDHSRDELRRLILDAARGIVARDGPQALSARAIASAVGYSPGTIYNIFRNLDDVVIHVNGETLDAMHDAVTVEAGDGDPAARLHGLARAYIAFARDNRALWELLFEYLVATDTPLPEWYTARVGHLFGLIEEPVRALMPHLPPGKRRHTALTLWSGVHGICALFVARRYAIFADQEPEAMARTLIDTFLAGIPGR